LLSKIEEYLKDLEKKEIYMLYVSILIVFGVIYYYLNYPQFDEIKTLNSKIIKLQKELRKKLPTVKRYKKQYISLLKQKQEAKSDYDYLLMSINTSDILVVDKESYFNSLKKMIKSSLKKSIYPSKITLGYVDEKLIRMYYYNVSGKFENSAFINFMEFIKSFENLKSINSVKTLNLAKADINATNVDFNITFGLWGVK